MFNFFQKSTRLFVLLRISNTLSVSRNYASSLFIPGNKASETFSYFSPYLDFDKRFADLDKLKKELSLRGLQINADELKETWDFYKAIDANKKALEDRRHEIGKKLEELTKKEKLSQEEKDQIVAFRAQSQVIKEDMKMIKECIWDLEDNVVVRALKLPNILDERTPEENFTILKTVREPENLPPENRKNHLDIGKNLGIVEYTNPWQYYLCNEAAFFELATLEFCSHVLGEDAIRLAGADFARSIVVEGSGLDQEDPMESFILADDSDTAKNSLSRLHLVGGASLVSVLSLHTKQIINVKKFPLRYFATGKQYTPVPRNSHEMGLFDVCQSSVVQVVSFVEGVESENYKIEFDNIIEKVIGIYDQLEIHYRVVMRPASELCSWESLRVSFEIWSVFNQQYIEVGFISACGDFISKRLLIAHQDTNGKDFPGIISGTVVSVPKLLACLLEQNPQALKIPNIIQPYMQKKTMAG